MADDEIIIPEELIDVLATYNDGEARAMTAAIAMRGILMGLDPIPDNSIYLLGLIEGEHGRDASLIDNARYMAGWSDGCVTFRANQARWN